MLTLVSVKIQESPELRGVNMAKGITSEDLSCDRVTLGEQVHEAIHNKMLEVLSDYMDKIATFAQDNGADGTAVLAAMEANIAKFKLDAGGGYTDTKKAYLLANGTDSGVEVIAEDFVAPKNRGGASTGAVKSSATTGDMEL